MSCDISVVFSRRSFLEVPVKSKKAFHGLFGMAKKQMKPTSKTQKEEKGENCRLFSHVPYLVFCLPSSTPLHTLKFFFFVFFSFFYCLVEVKRKWHERYTTSRIPLPPFSWRCRFYGSKMLMLSPFVQHRTARLRTLPVRAVNLLSSFLISTSTSLRLRLIMLVKTTNSLDANKPS